MAQSRPQATERQALLAQLAQPVVYDIAIVGGGATGLGVALDAATRGLRAVLVEAHDFAKGTSSRATKLVHGGVRYLAQGNVALVREALHERTTLLRNAPHLAQPLAFIMPSYRWWETPFYGAGLKLYDALAGKAGLGPTDFLGRAATLRAVPQAKPEGLLGGVRYWDGQFNDARLALALARTAAQHGALLVNYCRATNLLFDQGKVVGLIAKDAETGAEFRLQAGCVINATGVWVDELRHQDGEANAQDGRRPTKNMVAPSQGVHLVVDRSFWDSDTALMVPKTADGRVLFAVPWLGKLVLGTTDTPRDDLPLEPRPLAHEVEFILSESARYLRRPPGREDVLSCWVGMRPLVKPLGDEGDHTKGLSREHTVLVSRSNLVTVTGGKWTTYRAMAEDVLEKCLAKGLISTKSHCQTDTLSVVGAHLKASGPDVSPEFRSISDAPGLHSYGSEAEAVAALGSGSEPDLAPGLTMAMARFAARFEYARTVEDVLARRSRLLFLDARAARRAAPAVAKLLQDETGRDSRLAEFESLCNTYLTLAPGG
jgi:glycerol-3-phosphate dehydrogenase